MTILKIMRLKKIIILKSNNNNNNISSNNIFKHHKAKKNNPINISFIIKILWGYYDIFFNFILLIFIILIFI